MKIQIVSAIALLMLRSTVFGIPVLPFPGWEDVEQKSTDIIVARCSKTLNDPSSNRGLIQSEMVVECVLKGHTNQISVKLQSMYWPRPMEQYAIFSIVQDGVYSAIENYRVIPLGPHFPTNALLGKNLDEQIRFIFQYRIDALNRQTREDQEETMRLQSKMGLEGRIQKNINQ